MELGLHIPKNCTYRLRWAVGKAIPKEGLPEQFDERNVENVMFSHLPATPFMLTASVNFEAATGDNKSGSWKLNIIHSLHDLSIPSELGNNMDWLVKKLRYGPMLAGHAATESVPPGQHVALLRVRRFQDAIGGSYSIAQNPCQRFLVWLEPNLEHRSVNSILGCQDLLSYNISYDKILPVVSNYQFFSPGT